MGRLAGALGALGLCVLVLCACPFAGGPGAPSIVDFHPKSGPAGTLVTIQGTNLGPDPDCAVGGVPAEIRSASSDELVVVVGEGATMGPVVVQVGGRFDTSDGDFEVFDGSGTPVLSQMPAEVVLFESRPAPFGRVTEIEFGLPRTQAVSLDVYSVEGRLVANLARGMYPGGYHTVVWDGTDVRSAEVAGGVYFCRLVTEQRTLTNKMLKIE